MFEKLIAEQTKAICKTYKISEKDAKSALESAFAANPKIMELLDNETELKKIYRTSEFKNIMKKVKKGIYYGLRTYQKDDLSLEESHISTKERAGQVTNLLSQLDNTLSAAENILDIGGGMFPATFPFKKFPGIKNYTWIDKDTQSFEKLQVHKQQADLNNLYLHNETIAEARWEDYLPESVQEFDFVFMLKLIPVVYRQERDLLDKLAKVPAKHILITGSKEAMVKREDIEWREDKTLRKFIQISGFEAIKRVDIDSEFGYLLSA